MRPHRPPPEDRRRRRPRPPDPAAGDRDRSARRVPREEELHYGEDNRRRASEFAGDKRPNGRWARRLPGPPWADYEPEAATAELAVHQDVFGLAVESPGVWQQPPGPWMTGEHQAIEIDEEARPVDASPAPPPAARAPTRRPPTEPPPTERPPTERPPTERPVARAPTRRPPTERPPTEYPPTERPPTEYPPTERPPTQRPPTQRPPTQRPPTEYPPAEYVPAGRAPAGYPPGAPPAAPGAPPWPPPTGPPWPPPTGPPGPEPGASRRPQAPPQQRPPVLAPEAPPSATRGSFLVAAGILLSRCAGLIREIVIGAFLGVGPAADAFKAALRIPNLMQNLLGEGVLSASFIPVYARLRGEGRHEEAGRLAGAIAGLLLALTGAISLLGVVFTEPLARLLVPGYTGKTFDLTVQITRIMFPGMAFLVLSAWCLGVLNSHRKFFLSYVAPVVWNVAQIAFLLVGVLVVGGYETLDDKSHLAVALAWGVLVGGILQFAIQIGPVHRLLGNLRLSLDTGSEAVRSVISRFVPVLLGRGAIQIMGWVDLWLASYLVTGAVSSLTYTMVLYLLPVSLFGVSVAAAELPDLSQVEVHDPDTRRRFRLRLEDSMARIAWYVAPTATLFIVVGDVIVRAVFEHGSFSEADTVAVWLTLAFLSMGLLPITAARLLQNGLYALDDARTPARLGVVGVVLAAVFGVVLMFPLDRLVVGPTGITGWGDIFTFGPLPPLLRQNVAGIPHLGIVGLAIGATMSDWIEYRLLSRSLAWRIGRTHLAGRWLNQIAMGCIATAVVAYVADLAFGGLPALLSVILVVGPAAAAYLAVTSRLGVPEGTATVARLAGLMNRARTRVRP